MIAGKILVQLCFHNYFEAVVRKTSSRIFTIVTRKVGRSLWMSGVS